MKIIIPLWLIFYSIEYPSIVEENIRKVRQTVREIKVTLDKVSHDVSSTFENLKCMHLCVVQSLEIHSYGTCYSMQIY